MAYCIDVQNAYKVYPPNLRAVNGVCLQVEPGETIAILGPSKCGKTTLLRLLCGLTPLSDGSIRIAGKAIETWKANELLQLRRRFLGILTKDSALMGQLTVFEQVELPLALLDQPNTHRKERVSRMLCELGLSSLSHAFPGDLSAYQKALIKLGQALIHAPEILLIDEGDAGLCATERKHFWSFVKGLSSPEATTILFTDYAATTQQANRVLHMQAGILGEAERG